MSRETAGLILGGIVTGIVLGLVVVIFYKVSTGG